MREGTAWWRNIDTPEDRGGYGCWTVAPSDGRLPVLKRHALAEGLEILASSDVLPLWASTPDNWTLKQNSSIREPDPLRDCPAWLLQVFGAKWQGVG
jgi:hypothetical protein